MNNIIINNININNIIINNIISININITNMIINIMIIYNKMKNVISKKPKRQVGRHHQFHTTFY